MAKWQDLCELLMDKELTPQKIVEKLGVKPSRLKQMLESKRLAGRLELVEQIAAVRADHTILLAVEAAADKLAALAAKDTETGRKACLDVLAQGRLVRTEHESARSGRKLERWHNLFGGWGREAKRRPARQTAAPPPVPAPDEFVPPGGVGDPREGQPRNTACEQTVPPEGVGNPREGQPRNTACEQAVPPGEAAPPRRQRPAPPPRRMSKSKRRELAGLPPEKKRRIPVVPPPPGYGLDEPFVPRPGGRVVRHLVCGKVFFGST